VIRSTNKIMSAFVVLEPPGPQHAAIEHAERFIFLREKFSLRAFLFGPLWMIWQRLWVVLGAYLVGVGLVGYGLRVIGVGWLALALALGLVHLLIGLEATTLLRWTRARRGWRESGVVIADDLEMAERRFFDNRATLRPPAKSAPRLVPEQLAASQAEPSQPDIIGLFPEPGGGR
jgi:Protein of unknown function (DUF2628)